MRNCFCLILLSLCVACSEKGHHAAAAPELLAQVRTGLAEAYALHGETPDLDHRHFRNLIYELALHAQDESDKLRQIQDPNYDASKQVRHFAKASIDIVHEQHPGYPVPEIFPVLMNTEQLTNAQQILLLASSLRLIAQSGTVISKDPAGR